MDMKMDRLDAKTTDPKTNQRKVTLPCKWGLINAIENTQISIICYGKLNWLIHFSEIINQ